MSRTERYFFFATCAPGLEALLHAELDQHHFLRVERQVGGCKFEGTMEDAWRANLWLRTCVRVLRRVERFVAVTPEELYDHVAAVPWERWLAPEGTLIVDAQSRDSELNHTRFIEQKTKDAIVDRFRDREGVRPNVDKEDADLRVHVHVSRDRVTLSLDTSGDSLHKRGWRKHQGRAPLSEVLASACVMMSGWDRRAPLLDPFCGSGTIAIEAALLGLDIAPGLFRERFGFERWLDHDAAGWRAAVEEARGKRKPARKLRILASDSDFVRIEEARANVESAGVAEVVELECADAKDFAPRRGWNAFVGTNPPWGERLGDERELRELYARFGRRLAEHCAGYRVAILTRSGGAGDALGLPRLARMPIANGALDCELLVGEVPADAVPADVAPGDRAR